MRHLKRSGVSEGDLALVYKSVVRPVLDFASPTYHSLLTVTQNIQLEALQKRASKIIYGYDSSYNRIVAEGRLELLEERRKHLCVNFARKATTNKAFCDRWFPVKQMPSHNIRYPEKYLEERTKTERMRRNPLNYMRHELNKENKKNIITAL